MNASKLTSRKNRREERKKGKGSTTGQALTIISACLSSISLRSFSLPWWGLTPPRGQAPVDVVHVHVLTLKHAPGIPQRRRERHVRSVKAIRTMQSGAERMKAYISIDMEGICGIVRELETDPTKGGDAYEQSRHLMTQEANAAIEGCMKGGATEVLIADSHWNFDNLIPEELHEAATLLRGTPRGLSMMQDLDASFDAALFVGYHAKAGTPRAILDHTYSGTIAAGRVNGTEIGETGINAYLAGHHGVPVVLVTGDRALTAEAKARIPNIHPVAVKDATGATSARNLPPTKAREQSRAEATKAIKSAKSTLPTRAKTPIEMIVEFRGTYAADRAAMIPTVRRVGGLRCEFEADDYPEAFRVFYALGTIAADEWIATPDG